MIFVKPTEILAHDQCTTPGCTQMTRSGSRCSPTTSKGQASALSKAATVTMHCHGQQESGLIFNKSSACSSDGRYTDTLHCNKVTVFLNVLRYTLSFTSTSFASQIYMWAGNFSHNSRFLAVPA